MKNFALKALVFALAIMTLFSAFAETASFSGSVIAYDTDIIFAPIGGTVDEIKVSVGEKVNEGDTLCTLKTTKVYAEEAGVITGVFGAPGDSCENVAKNYGAVMYIEGEGLYTIKASTEKAYDATENKFVHVGETVYLWCVSDGEHTGMGMITNIQGTDYTVKVLTGTFTVGEDVNIYRGEEALSVNRIGRGTLSRKDPVSVTGTGSIAKILVNDGDTVKKGQLIMETLSGTYDGYYMSGTEIVADKEGVIAEIKLEKGNKVEKDQVAAVLYPESKMRIKGEISEGDLYLINEGDQVEIELNCDDSVVYEGTVYLVSSVATTQGQSGMGTTTQDETTYSVYIDFTPNEFVRYGMNATITTK